MIKHSSLQLFLLLLCVILINWASTVSDEDSATCEINENGECVSENDGKDSPDLDAMSTHERIAYLKRLDEKERKEKEEKGIEPNFREMKVLFQNKSGQKVKLFWKGPNENVLQAEMDSPGETIINTFIGHEFFYTPFDDESSELYSARMEKHVELIQLLTPQEMKKRDKAFEAERRRFMQEYHKKTGRSWLNYYPREPVSLFMYDITQIGQTFITPSNHTKYRTCPESFHNNENFQSILTELERLESEYKIEFLKSEKERLLEEEKERAEIEKEEAIDEKSGLKKSVGDDRNWFHKIPVYNSFSLNYTDNESNNLYKVLRYNGTVYCQNYDEIQEIELNVLCTQPRLVNILEFLSDEECEHIKEIGQYLGLKRSTVSEAALQSLDRTSQTVWIERKFSPIVDEVIMRIGDSLHIDHRKLYLNASSESLQLVHYYGGELYKPHWDYGTDAPNNRFITFLMYLHNVEEGGNTSFPNAHKNCTDDSGYLGVRPVKRSAAWFYDLYPDGNVDDSTLHYAEPPGDNSEKWMTNLWIWDPYFGS